MQCADDALCAFRALAAVWPEPWSCKRFRPERRCHCSLCMYVPSWPHSLPSPSPNRMHACMFGSSGRSVSVALYITLHSSDASASCIMLQGQHTHLVHPAVTPVATTTDEHRTDAPFDRGHVDVWGACATLGMLLPTNGLDCCMPAYVRVGQPHGRCLVHCAHHPCMHASSMPRLAIARAG